MLVGTAVIKVQLSYIEIGLTNTQAGKTFQAKINKHISRNKLILQGISNLSGLKFPCFYTHEVQSRLLADNHLCFS